MTWSALVGTVAALVTTLAFLPQLVKARQQGGDDLSWGMLAMYLGGQCLWLVYGLVNQAGAVIGATTASIALVSAVALTKFQSAHRLGRATRRLRVAVDMDDVMADAVSEHLRRYNAAFGALLTLDDLRGRDLESCVPVDRREATEAMLDATFFQDLAVMPDCQDVIRELAACHEVFIATAAMDVPSSFEAKYRWLRQHFPFIAPSNIVFCGDKSIVDADFLIDDRPRHFTRFKGRPLLFAAPHNVGESRYTRVASWTEVRDLFRRLGALPHAGSSVRHSESE